MHAGSSEARARIRGSHRIRFKIERANEITDALGLDQIQDKAAYFGPTETTYSRVVRGITNPGEDFIAAVLAARPELTFDDLFELVEAD